MTSFASHLIATIRQYRERAASAGLSRINIAIETEGRIDGDLKITFRVSEGYGENLVKGNTLEDVFLEFLRRKGWNGQHQPLCLPNVDDGETHGDFVEDNHD